MATTPRYMDKYGLEYYHNLIRKGLIEYIVGTQTATTNAWTGVSKSPSLFAGKVIIYHLPFAGTGAAATLNLTLTNGSTTGAKAVQNETAMAITTEYAAGSDIFMVYTGGCWKCSATGKDYVTPEMFGAVGDGVTDDTAAIQAAIYSGKNVLFAKRTYLCGQVNINGNNIIIDGGGATIVHGENSGFVMNYTAHDILIKRFDSICEYEVDSNKSTNVHIGINTYDQSPNEEFYAYNITVQDCKFTGGVIGISASSVKNIKIDNCKFNGMVYKTEDGAGGYGVLLQSCIDAKITDCDFTMGAYGRHDIYISVDQRKTSNIRCRNIAVDRCSFDHSLLEVDREGYFYYSPNTVCVNIRASCNVSVKKCRAYSVTGLVAFFSEDGNIIGGAVDDCVVEAPVYNAGPSEAKQVITLNGVSGNSIQTIIDNVTVTNIPNNYETFASITYGTAFITNCDIGKERIICGAESTIFINNVKTAITYYFCRFNGTTRGYISNVYFDGTLVGDKYYYAPSVDVSGMRIRDDEHNPTLIPLTANTNYISGFTNMSYRVGKVGYINCIFTVPTEIPANTSFITFSENVKTRFDGVIYKNNAFKGRIICQNSDIMPNVTIAADQSYHSINAVVIFN